MTLRHYAFSRQHRPSSLKTSMHLYCDVTSLCKFGALKSYLFLVLSRVPLKELPRVNRRNDPAEDQKSPLLSFQQFYLNFAVFLSNFMKT